MKSKIKLALKIVVPIVFWLSVWEISAIIINKTYFLPRIKETLQAFGEIAVTGEFYTSILYTILRVNAGLVLGFVLGVLLGFLCHYFFGVNIIISPIMSIIKSTPVASFITLLWIMFDGNSLAISIAVMMVMPIIWQSVIDGLGSVNKDLREVGIIFNFGIWKRFKYLIFPSIYKFLVPAAITAVGLGWKAEIAAEIMGYVKHSIGGQINDASYNSNTPQKLAWTIIIILFSIVLERLASYFLRRYRNGTKVN